MKELEPRDREYWYENMRETREMLRELVLENGELISKPELLERLARRGIRVYEDEDGTTHYEDETLEDRVEEPDDGNVTAKTVQLPVIRATRLVERRKHPNNLDSVERKAERMVEFDKVVTPVFNLCVVGVPEQQLYLNEH